MSNSSSVVSDSSVPEQSKMNHLSLLPEIQFRSGVTTPRMQQQLDLLLLGIEALQLKGTEYMLGIASDMGLDSMFKHKVVLWRMRCSNPWRRYYTRNSLTLEQAKALTLIIGYMAKGLNLTIRQLVIAEQQMREKGFPVDNHFRLSEYLEKFRADFRTRMNPRRTKVAIYLADENKLNDLALSVLNQLFLAGGSKGMQRLWFSLFDGEI